MSDAGIAPIPAPTPVPPTPIPANDLMSIRNVEIFRVGEHNGADYSRSDLDSIVNSFGRVGYEVPITLGHFAAEDAPAYGWVENLRMNGDVLVADFRDIPRELYDAIRAHRYDHVSVEIFFDVKRNGVEFDRALKSVALLGAHTPAVAGLAPLREAQFKGTFAKVVRVNMSEATPARSDNPEVAQLRQQVAELRARQEDREEQDRISRCADKTKAIVVPSLRPFFAAMYDAVTKTDKPVMVTLSVGATPERVTAEIAVDKLAAKINEAASSLFVQRASRGFSADTGGYNTAGEELNAKVQAMVSADPTGKLAYGAAFTRFTKDPANAELVSRYNDERG